MSDRDPAVTTWQDSIDQQMAASTSAIARQLTGQLEQLRRDYNAVLLERDKLADELADARGQMVDLLYTLDAFQIESGADRNAALQTGIEAVRRLRTENERLHALVIRGPGRYHLTDKGRAATDA